MKIRKLSARNFARAVRLGHGSALLHLKAYGDNGLEKTIIDAMLNCYVYDWQIEGSRQYWIFSLVAATQRTPFYADCFFEKIKTHLATGNDRAQQIQLCRQFFEAGYSQAREAAIKMYPALLASSPCRADCGRVFIDMAGQAGFEFVVKAISETLADIDSWTCSSIYEHAENLLDLPSEPEEINKLIQKHPAGRRFYEAVRQFKEEYVPRQKNTSVEPPRIDLKTILQMIEKKQFAPRGHQYTRKGKNLNAEEIAKLLELLKTTQDQWEKLCFLRIFKNHNLPYVTPDLLTLVDSSDKQIAFAAAKAFAATKNALIREKGLELLNAHRHRLVAYGIELLETNYVEGDAQIVLKAIKRLRNSDILHRAGCSIQTIAERNRDGGMEKLLVWLYENNPDSFCRDKIMDRLSEWNVFPAQLLYEAQWDCSDDLQLAARKLLSEQN